MIRKFIALACIIFITGCGGGIVTDSPLDYDGLIDSGWDAYNMASYNKAWKHFNNAQQYDDLRPEAYIGLGWTHLRKQHPDSSIVAFRTSFEYITTLKDSVDSISGLAGAYLAGGDNIKTVNLFNQYPVSSYDDAFPIRKHDFFIDISDLDVVKALAYYRLGYYSSTESADPANSVYYLNQVLISPHVYTDPESLMKDITDFLESESGGYYK